MPRFTVEKLEQTRGRCDCCGREGRCIAGLIYDRDNATAAYWIHWTDGHLDDVGANLDFVLGEWGDGTSPADRYVIALVYRHQADGTSALMLIDADGRPAANGTLAGTTLRRQDVVGTPLAARVFALADAVHEQDDRFF